MTPLKSRAVLLTWIATLQLMHTTSQAFVVLPSLPPSLPVLRVPLSSTTSQLNLANTKKGFSSSSNTNANTNANTNTSTEEKERQKAIDGLQAWATSVGILRKDIKVAAGEPIIGGGLGLLTTNTIPPNTIMLQVPTHLTFSTSNSKLDSNPKVEALFEHPKVYNEAPWWAKLAVDLIVCNDIDSFVKNNEKDKDDGDDKIDMRPWLDSLPQSFDTPIRWTVEQRNALQYTPLVGMIAIQESLTRKTHEKLLQALSSSSSTSLKDIFTYEKFLWGCDCARSRAFSGSYGGSAFDPKPYAFTLLLVAVYIGLGMGTIEQASNGAGLVLCGSILKDFVFPKLFKSKKYIICPMVDMANHVGIEEDANVAFEYFTNGYSLNTKADVTLGENSKEEVFISYGPRSNDALLQQYGFVEADNAHDVYVMPPLREWDIAALEEACGRKFQPGRLQKLERAGLLGGNSLGNTPGQENEEDLDAFEEGVANRGRGVVVTRAGGIDPAIITALRVLVSSEEEWLAVGEAVGNLVTVNSGGKENERLALVVAQKALELELLAKPTTLGEDEESWKNKNSLGLGTEDMLALQFRIEKKKLLKEAMFALSLL